MPLKWTHLLSEHDQFDGNSFFAGIFAKHPRLRSVPGQKMSYSNLGYILLGQVIEQVSGQRYEDYITENILQELAAPGELSFTIRPPLHAKGYQGRYSMMNLLLGVLRDKQKFMGAAEGAWKPFRLNYVNGVAYGGLIATAPGLVKYGQAILNHSILSPAARQQYFTEHILPGGKHSGMSLSWFTGQLNGQAYYHHAGGGGGYYVELRLYPGANCGSVLVCNRSGMKDERFLDKLDVHLL
jgi:CubicO group peptidase (beta-lactamase class C family)